MRRRVARAVERHIVRAGLVDTSGGSCVGALVDGALHLLQDLVNLDQVGLGANVGHGRQLVVLGVRSAVLGPMTVHTNHSRSRHVLAHMSSVDGEGAMQGHQPLANLSV
jgi:hypothetical protein